MASSFNRVILMGNLTADPELIHTAGGHTICKVRMAVNRKYKTKDGDLNEETTYVDADFFGRQAETIAQYLTKGNPIHIEGRLRQDNWEDKEGNKRSKLVIVGESFQFVDSGATKNDDSTSKSTNSAPKRETVPSIDSDDIPF